MMKMTALLTAALMSLGYGAYDAKAQATYFGDEPEGVQSFQQDKDAWRRKDGKRLQILQGINRSGGTGQHYRGGAGVLLSDNQPSEQLQRLYD